MKEDIRYFYDQIATFLLHNPSRLVVYYSYLSQSFFDQ